MLDRFSRLLPVLIPLRRQVDLVCWLASGIWLLFLGQWWAIGIGLLGLFISRYVVSLLLLPNILVATITARAHEAGRFGAAGFLAGISSFYVSVVATIWSIPILGFFTLGAGELPLIPFLVWSYAVATDPWHFLAIEDLKSGGNLFSAMTVTFLQAGYVVSIILMLATKSLEAAGAALLIAMIFNFIWQLLMLRTLHRFEHARAMEI